MTLEIQAPGGTAMSLIEIHGRLGNTALFYVILMAIWGLWRYFRKQDVDSSYFGALIIAEVIFVIQGLLGGYLWISGIGHLASSMHILYGIVNVLVVPGIFLFTHGESSRRTMLIYGLGFVFLIGIVLRSMETAG